MAKTPPPRVPTAQLAYVAVFGVFVFIYLARVLNGKASTFDYITLSAAIVLLLIAAYRVLISLRPPPDA
jgi:hypothetical protein